MTDELERNTLSGVGKLLPPITVAGRDEPLPLSFAQQRMWFLAQMEGVSRAYHIPLGLRLTGELDGGALRRALDRLVARHEALRTTFPHADGQPVQHIAAENGDFGLDAHDLRQHSNAEGELRRLAIEEANAAFDLQAGPLIRGRLIRLGENEHVLLITMHHIVSDGWSRVVLTRELGALYRAYSQGQADPLPALAIQYPDYAVWQRRWLAEEVLQAQSDYWQRTLAGAPAVLELPTDRRRPVQQDHAGALVALELDDDLTAGLKALGQRHGTTLFMTLLAAWAALLARLSGQDDVVIGTPVANRGRAEVEPLIGFFVNSLALRLDLSGGPTIGELLQRVKARTLEAQQHQDLPFEQVVEIMHPPRSLAHAPVFQMMFAWQNSGENDLELPGLTVAPVRTPRCFAKFDLTLSLAEVGGRIVGGLEYATALFDRATVERHAGYLRKVLAAMVADDAQAVDRLSLLGDAERRQVLVEWNATEADYPRDKCVHELFEAQAARTPDAIAIGHEDAQLTYAELNARANRLAHHLRGLGVKPDGLVAIGVERSLDMVVGLLAILKAGGAYVPLDPAYPAERLAYMLEDSAPAVVLTHAQAQVGLRAAFGGATAIVPVINLEADAARWAAQPDSNPDRTSTGLTSRHLAYVIYTSGSTGQPKGVMNEHCGVVNRLNSMQRAYGLNQGDAVLQKTPFSFDVSVWEFFWPLLAGARLVMAKPEGHKDPSYLSEIIRRENITTLHFVPSMLDVFLEQGEVSNCASLRRVMCSGEVLPGALVKRFHERLSGTELHNLYGPTEAAVEVTAWTCVEGATTVSVPIGRPISNTRIYILDGHGEPVPIGVAGEIHIGGVQVARGYLNRSELTAERFVADPFAEGPNGRMFKSGDLGRYLPDGTIEFLGRNDFQVKIRGFRVELGEIEVRLAQHSGVREAVVLAREAGGNKRLSAYYTLAASASDVGAEELRRHLSAALPEYMIPAAYVRLDALPLTANGKLDRKALPAPDAAAYAARGYEAAAGEIETRLARIWADVLGLDRVGRRDNFFELGGHSLLAMRLIARVASTFDVKINVMALFQAPTLRELAAWLSNTEAPKEAWGIVQIQPLGDKTPIIVINDTIIYQSYILGRKIGTDRRVLGIQLFDPSNPQLLPCRSSLEEIAAEYVRLIREAQPRGPYILFGLCVGGVIAYEAAQQLRQAGAEVPLVVMADTWEPGYRKRLPFIQRFLLNWSDRYHVRKHQFGLIRSDKETAAGRKIRNLLSALRLIEDHSNPSKEDLGNGWFLPYLAEAQDCYQAPASVDTVVMFQSDSIVTRFADPKMGWSDVVNGRVSVYRIPGWHVDMLQDEGAALIAEHLRPLLDRVDAELDRAVTTATASQPECRREEAF